MQTTAPATAATMTSAATLAQALRVTAERFPDRPAFRTVDDSTCFTWSQTLDRSDAIAGGLAKLGLKRGDTLALMLSNRPEFALVDFAATTVGATPFSIYQTLAPEQIAYVVADAGARIAIIESQFLDQFLSARKDLPELEHLIVLDGDGPSGTLALAEVEGSNPEFDPVAAADAVEPEDLATLIYTSGTTGPPKGVQLSHNNLICAVSSVRNLVEFPDGAHVISWLPAAHVAERVAHHYLPLMFGFTVTSCANPKEIVGYLPQVRPHWFFAVPRIWEKLKAGLEAMVQGKPEDERAAFEQALAVSRQRVQLRQEGTEVPAEIEAAAQQADDELFSGLRSMLGLDRVVTVNVGAAPTPFEVLEFFHAIGIEIAELWGMSETCGAGTINPPDAIRLGTVGPPLEGIEITLADDGEVLVRGNVVMVSYRNMPEATAETIDPEGWLHTGDIGEFDDAGYLRIVDRKKELIINAAGKNMSPANIEGQIKTASPLIGQACVVGDGRPYNVALLTLDPDFAPIWAAQQGIDGTDLATLAQSEQVLAEISAAVERANGKMARVEQIKKFELLGVDWLPGGTELTPTMKLKRKPISEHYQSEIEALYAG